MGGLRKDILELDGDTRRFMEEIEISAVGVFLWQCNCKRYIDQYKGLCLVSVKNVL